jgi:O-antigen/teichoic acid export membrane protein
MAGRTRRALKNSAIQGGSQVITWALSWVLLVVLPRFLGDEGFGKLFLGLSYSMVLGTIMNLGINKYLVKRVAVLNPAEAASTDSGALAAQLHELLSNVFALKLFMSVSLYAFMAVIVLLLPYEPTTRAAILIVCVAACLDNLTLTAASVHQGFERMVPPNIAIIAEKLLTTVMCTALLFAGYGLIPVCAVYVAGASVNCLISLGLLRRRVSFGLAWNAPMMKSLLIGGLPFLIWIVFGEIYVRVDVLMLSFMTDQAVVGWYGAAFRIYATLLFVPHMLNTVVFPPLARMGADEAGHADFAVATRRVMNLLLVAVIPIGTGVSLISSPLVLLLYGEGPFVNSIPSLRLFGACIVVVSVDVVLGSALIAKGKQKVWSYMAIVAAAFNPALNAWLIPVAEHLWQNGGIGAAVATLATEILMMAGAITLMPQGILSPQWLVTALKAGLAAALMAATVLTLGIESVPGTLLVSVAVYAIAAVFLRVLPPADIAHLLHAAGLQERFVPLQRILGVKRP